MKGFELVVFRHGIADASMPDHDRVLTEEGIRSLAGQLKLPKEVLGFIVSQAEKRVSQMIEAAKTVAKDEGNREKAAAKAEIEQEVARAREQLRDQVAMLAVAGAEKILRREVDAKAHADLLDGIKKQL